MLYENNSLPLLLHKFICDFIPFLIITACHPLLSPEARAALTLRLIGGLTTDEIARAFLSNEPTIAQRIVRAKKSLGGTGRLSKCRAARSAKRASPRCLRSST